MEFLERLKQDVKTRLSQWGQQFEAASARLVYSSVAGLTLWQVYEAIQGGENPFIIGGSLSTMAGSVGCSLIAGELQKWRDKSMSLEAFLEDINGQLANPEFRKEVDEIVLNLEAVDAARSEMTKDQFTQFNQALHQELKAYGNLPRFEAVLSDESILAHGENIKIVKNGQLYEKDVLGDAMAPGSTKNVYNINLGQDEDKDIDDHLPAQGVDISKAYLKHLHKDARYISLQSFAKEEADKGQSLVELGAVYTALRTREMERHKELEKMGAVELTRTREQRFLSVVEQVNEKEHLVLLGDPGSGKSTFLKYFVLCMTGEMLEQKEINLEHLSHVSQDGDEEEKVSWKHGRLLPIFIQLRDFAVKALPPTGEAGSACYIWNYLKGCLQSWGISEYFETLKQEVLDSKHTSLILFDGLDEVPDPQNQRKQIKQTIEDFIKTANCRIIVTSRTYAYQKQDWELEGFHAAELAPFNEDQIRTFIDQWYGYQAKTGQREEEDALGRAKLLKDAVFEKNRRLQGLAERPLLLTLMAVLHSWHGQDLPEKRVDIYEQTLDLLIHRWNSRKDNLNRAGASKLQAQDLSVWLKGGRTDLRRLLERLAFEAHHRQSSEDGRADVPKKDLVYGLVQISKDVLEKDLEEYIKDRMGILVERGHEVFTFPHRTFQEYLAACYLTRTEFPDNIAELTRREPQRWREVAQLVGLKVNTAHSGWALVEYLCGDARTKGHAWGTLIAGEFLVESDWSRHTAGIEAQKHKKYCGSLAKIISSTSLPAIERALAGRLTAQLGDPRKEVMTLEGMLFCKVPTGSFWMGAAEHDKDASDREKPGFENTLDYEYHISRYPVSHAQYRYFIQNDGYQQKKYWIEAIADGRWKPGQVKIWHEWQGAPEDYDFPYTLDNHPVVGVSWYEAMAFCRWLTEYLKTSDKTSDTIKRLLHNDYHITLPSEAEWEKAARGVDDQRIYPWGDDRDTDKANYDQTKIGTPSALGCFPQGQSPFKCEDMAGNVLEWCRTSWQGDYSEYKNELKSSDKETSRVFRGGAFDDYRRLVRCSFRGRNHPSYRNGYIGFRVCVCPHFSEI